MPEFSSYPAGTPSWVDHATRDLSASHSFYGNLLGWTAEDQGEEMGHYTLYQKGGRTVAGDMAAMGDEQPCVWTSYISVEDADATVAAAREAGATVYAEPMDVSDIGRMAILADPTGAVFGIWQPRTFIGAELANEPGALTWNELNTRDLDAAKTFYSGVFGWTAHDMDMGPMSYTEWKLGDRTIGGMLAMPEQVPAEVPSHWLAYFGVDDTDAAVATATGAGGTLFVPPTDIPAGRFAVLADPDGAMFAVIKLADAPA
jgi:predicted enzyme related to lactoylglutathione lyase